MNKIFFGFPFWLVITLTSFQIKATDYYLVSGSASIYNVTSWGVNTDGSGSNPTDFSSTGDVWHFVNRTTIALPSPFASVLSALVVIGDGVSGTTLTVAGGGSTRIISSINMNNLGGLIVNRADDMNYNILNPNSSIVFNTIGLAIKPGNYGHITIATSMSLNPGTGGAIDIYGTLTLNSAKTLSLSQQSLILHGAISVAGTGSITGDNAGGNISLLGGNGSNSGTLFFTNGSQFLSGLYVYFAVPNTTIVLGNDLTIDRGSSLNNFELGDGCLDLNGKKLIVESTTSTDFFTTLSGVFKGSSASELIFKGPIGNVWGGTTLLLSNGNNTLKSLSIDNIGASLDIGNPVNILDSLGVLNGILTTNGNITLKASNSITARIGRLGGTISGNITAETFVPGSTTGWANWGSNGVGGQTVANWEAIIPMACENCPNNVTSAGGYFESIQSWFENPGAYDTTIVYATPLSAGKGFWVYVGSGLTSTTDYTLTNTGAPVTGNVTVPVTASGTVSTGFNLVANPYASPVSWSKVLAASGGTTNFADAIYVWNADLGSGSGLFAQRVGGVSSPGGSTGISDAIPAGQGFYVQAQGSTNLQFTEACKTNANTNANPLLRTSSQNNIGKFFRLKVQGTNNDNDETVIRIHNEATENFDLNWDANKIFDSPGYVGYPGSYSKYTTISTRIKNEDYSINSLPPLYESNKLPLLVRVMYTGTYTINAFDFEGFDMCLGLLDKLTNTYTDLRQGSYVCQINDTTSAPRFELFMCKDESLNTVGIAKNELASNILISQDNEGAFVKTSFEQKTKATISVYNIMGQQLIKDIQVDGLENTTRLYVDLHNQVVLVKVTTDKRKQCEKNGTALVRPNFFTTTCPELASG